MPIIGIPRKGVKGLGMKFLSLFFGGSGGLKGNFKLNYWILRLTLKETMAIIP